MTMMTHRYSKTGTCLLSNREEISRPHHSETQTHNAKEPRRHPLPLSPFPFPLSPSSLTAPSRHVISSRLISSDLISFSPSPSFPSNSNSVVDAWVLICIYAYKKKHGWPAEFRYRPARSLNLLRKEAGGKGSRRPPSWYGRRSQISPWVRFSSTTWAAATSSAVSSLKLRSSSRVVVSLIFMKMIGAATSSDAAQVAHYKIRVVSPGGSRAKFYARWDGGIWVFR